VESLVQNIALIPQDSSLFHRTVFENILYGKIGASEAEVIEAAKKAHCHDFIIQMKEGYQTIVGERGMRLSGGQRQRLAIARAVLKNAPILILDEATSALDSYTEVQIQESLRLLMQKRTALVIAHRLSTLKKYGSDPGL
jgi:ATP-binding cassette subfamily B protein